MKGLLYKDILILVKQLKFALFMVAVFCLIPNISFGLNRFFLLYGALFLPVTLFSLDETCHWDIFSGFLPCSRREIVLSKYILGWLGLVFGGVFFVIGLNLPINGEKESFLSLVIVAGFALLFQGIIFPFLFRFGSTKGRLVSMLAIVIVAVVAWTAYDLFDSAGFLTNGGSMVWLLLLAGVFVCAFSIPISERQFAIRQG